MGGELGVPGEAERMESSILVQLVEWVDCFVVMMLVCFACGFGWHPMISVHLLRHLGNPVVGWADIILSFCNCIYPLISCPAFYLWPSSLTEEKLETRAYIHTSKHRHI